MTKLKPCPFCGSDNLEEHNFYITCLDCQADGPFAYDTTAIEAWNTRNNPKQLKEQND